MLRDDVRHYLRQAFRSLPPAVRGWLSPLRDSYVENDIPNARRRLLATIQPVAAQISREAATHKGERVFVDCGFNTGEVLQGFIDTLPKGFKYYGFEVNEPLFAELAKDLLRRNPEVVSLQFQAVSDRDGEIEFFPSGTDHGLVIGEATTIIQGMPADGERYGRARKAKSIDFSKWVDQVVQKHTSGQQPPYLAIKMDIEGAEYMVLEHMNDMGTLSRINYLIIEYHSYLFEGSLRQEYEAREERLRALLAKGNVQVQEWG
jgi:FkbM family methyltransferase